MRQRAPLAIAMALTLSALLTGTAAQERGLRVLIKAEDGRLVSLYDKSYALVVGVSDYTAGWSKLPGVKKDIEEVSRALEKHGFQVMKVENPDSVQLEKSFKDFIDTYGQGPDSRLLFYFAGHGHTVRRSFNEEMGYVVPTDAPNPNLDHAGFMSKALDMEQVERFAKRIESKHAIFLFDSCFSGSLFNISRALPENISYKMSRPVRQFITSGSADERVPDRSVFRDLFVSALEGEADRDKDGYVTGTELGMFLQDKVIIYSKNSQHPQYGKIRNLNLDKGDFIFMLAKPTPQPTPLVTAPLVSDTSAVEISFWNSIQNSRDAEEFREYLSKYPAGQFAGLARRRLAALASTPLLTPAATPVSQPPPVGTFDPAAFVAALNEKAEESLRRSGNQAVINTTTQAIALDPRDGVALRLRAGALSNAGEGEKAKADAAQALRLLASPAGARQYEARCAARNIIGETGQTLEDCTKAIRLDPKFALAYFSRGNAYYYKKDYDHAIADYTEAIRLDSQFASAYNNRGGAYSDKKDYDRAIPDYTEAIRFDPKLAVAYHNRGTAYSDKKDYDRAIPDYNEAVRLDPKFALAYNNRGAAYYYKSEYNRAIADFTEAIRLNPTYAAAYNSRGLAYSDRGEYDRAIGDFTEAIRLDPKYPWPYHNRGTAYAGKKDYDRAVTNHSEAIRLDPQYASAYNSRGYAYYEKKDYDRAIVDYTEAIRLDSQFASAYNNRGAAYYEKNEYNRAIADFTEAIRLDPKYAGAYTNRGMTYSKLGDAGRAATDRLKAEELRKQQ